MSEMTKSECLSALIADDQKFAIYELEDYVSYCRKIRSCVKDMEGPRLDSKLRDFFEQKFVQEMEPIAKIADRFCRKPGTKVQYLKDDPPDGRVIFDDGAEFGIECTSSRNDRLIKLAIEQNHLGIPTSTTGHTVKDFEGNRHTGYRVAGHGVGGETLECQHEKARQLICERIEGKIPKLKASQWLSVFVDEHELPEAVEDLQSLFDSISLSFQGELVDKGISKIFFVGTDKWLSSHALI